MNPNPVVDRTVSTLMLSAFVAVAATVAAAAWLLFIVVTRLAVDATGALLGMTCT